MTYLKALQAVWHSSCVHPEAGSAVVARVDAANAVDT